MFAIVLSPLMTAVVGAMTATTAASNAAAATHGESSSGTGAPVPPSRSTFLRAGLKRGLAGGIIGGLAGGMLGTIYGAATNDVIMSDLTLWRRAAAAGGGVLGGFAGLLFGSGIEYEKKVGGGVGGLVGGTVGGLGVGFTASTMALSGVTSGTPYILLWLGGVLASTLVSVGVEGFRAWRERNPD